MGKTKFSPTLRMLNPDGVEEGVPQGRIGERLQQGWRPLGGQTIGLVATSPNDNPTTVNVKSEEIYNYLNYVNEAGGGVSFSPKDYARTSMLDRDRVLREDTEDSGGSLAFANEVIDFATLGALDTDEIYGSGAKTFFETAKEENPGATAATRYGLLGGSLLVPGAGAARGALSGARAPGYLRAAAAASGPIGAARVAGEGAVKGLGALGVKNAKALRAGQVVAEGAAAEAAFAVQHANVTDTQLSAEEILADASVGAALGLGVDSLLSRFGVGGVRKALSETPGSRLANGGRLGMLDEAARATDDVPASSFSPKGGRRGRATQEELDAHESIFRGLRDDVETTDPSYVVDWAAKNHGVSPRKVAAASDEVVKKFYVDADEILNAGRRSSKGLNQFLHAEESLAKRITQRARELGHKMDPRIGGDQAGIAAHASVDDVLSMVNHGIKDPLDGLAGRLAGTADGAKLDRLSSLLKASKGQIGGVLKGGGAHPADIYERVGQLALDIDGLAIGKMQNEGARAVATNARSQVRGFLKDKAVWGELGPIQGELDELMHNLLKKKDAVRGLIGKKSGFLSDKISGHINKAATKDASLEMLEAVPAYVEAAHALVTRAKQLGLKGKDLDAITDASQQVLHDIREGIAIGRSRNLIGSIKKAPKGPLKAVMDMAGGAILHGALGSLGLPPTLAAVLGAASRMVFSRMSSKEASASRFSQVLGVQGRIGARVQGQRSRLFQALSGGKRPTVGGGLAMTYAAFKDRGNPEKVAGEFVEIRDELRGLVEDPMSLYERVSLVTSNVSLLDQDVGEDMALRMVSAAQYLNSVIPQGVVDPLTSEESLPSHIEIDSFIDKYMALQDPLSLLDDLAMGRLTHDTVEAVVTVYPKLYAEMATTVLETMREVKDISYQDKIVINQFLGIPDPTTETSFMLALSAPVAQDEQQGAMAQQFANPSAVSLGKAARQESSFSTLISSRR